MNRPRTRWRAAQSRLLIVLAMAVGMSGLSAPPASASPYPVEDHYEDAGGWAVSQLNNVTDPRDPTPWEDSYTIFYPTNLGNGGYDHPVLAWGNGGSLSPQDHATLLTHFASWGYVVVAPDSGFVGTDRMVEAVAYMWTQHLDPSSIFHDNLDMTKVGAVGQSQGSVHALRATQEVPGLIKSTAGISVVNPDFWNLCLTDPEWEWPAGEAPCEEMTEDEFDDFPVPLFLPRGNLLTDDILASDGWHTDIINASSNMGAKGSRRFCGHFACIDAPFDTLSDRIRGYITAWFEYTLKGDAFARTAFAGGGSELFTNDDWTNQQVNNPI